LEYLNKREEKEIYKQLLVGHRQGFIDEHDRNVILYGVQELAIVTDKAIFSGGEFEVAFALGTAKDIEKFFLDRHGIS
jgi:hypothetical protein